jgi:hypothetical protein
MINVLILSFSHVNTDPRVLRQINYFEKTGAKISLSAVSYDGIEDKSSERKRISDPQQFV